MANSGNNQNLKYALLAIGAVVVIFLILVVVKSPTTQDPNAGDSLAPASLVNDIVSLKNSTVQSVGIGTASSRPQAISGPALSQNGKPEVLYIGAEYCPYCATERWAMVIALTRFGTFSNLRETHSSSTDVYPDTQTFSFYKSSYTSNYIAFVPVETYSNIPSGNSYTVLDKTTSQQQSLMNTYDSSPYVPADDAGAIPFIYFGGKYLVNGATYSPQVLQGQSYNQIASALSHPKSTIAQGADGAANLLTAAICGLTKNQPSNVCTTGMQAIEGALSK